MRRLTILVGLLLTMALTVTACGGGGSAGGASRPTKVIDITFHGDTVTPNGQRYDVAVGQRIELDVTADKPGEIHVHSSPEQEFQYDAGSSTLSVKPMTTPGIVTVESHTLGKVLFQLRVQ